MKRTISLLLIITFVCAQMVIPTYAADLMSFTVGSCDAAPGETVSVPILLNSNTGFVSMSLSVTYDTTALTLISYEDTGVISGASHSSHFTSPYVLTWENDTLTSNIISTGTIVYLTFLVSEDAKEQDYSIIVRIPTDGILDANGDTVSASSAMGTITVSAEHECSFGDWEYYSKTKHIRYCNVCDEKEYKNHNWDDGEIIKEPSHDEEGEIEYICPDCSYTKTIDLDALGHAFGDWEKYDDDQHKRKCSCGENEYEIHNWGAGIVTQPPTNTETGIRSYTCNDCGATKNEEIDSTVILATGVQLNETNITIIRGNSANLIAFITPKTATNQNIIWTTSNPDIASVSNGIVTAKSVGTATITATTEDGGYTAQCEVTVERRNDDYVDETIPVTGIILDHTYYEMSLAGANSNIVINATISPENATNKEIIWKSSNGAAVDIAFFDDNSKVLIVALSPGVTEITATTVDGTYIAQCIIVVKDSEETTDLPDYTDSESNATTENPDNTDNESNDTTTEEQETTESTESEEITTEAINVTEGSSADISTEVSAETNKETSNPSSNINSNNSSNKNGGCFNFVGFSGIVIITIISAISVSFFKKKEH